MIAVFITISGHLYGGHDFQGFLAVAVLGLPGLLACGKNGPINEALFTLVNWLFCFSLVEAVFAIRKTRFRAAKSSR